MNCWSARLALLPANLRYSSNIAAIDLGSNRIFLGPSFALALAGIQRRVVHIMAFLNKRFGPTMLVCAPRLTPGEPSVLIEYCRHRPGIKSHFFRPFICTGSRRNPAACGAYKGIFKNRICLPYTGQLVSSCSRRTFGIRSIHIRIPKVFVFVYIRISPPSTCRTQPPIYQPFP